MTLVVSSHILAELEDYSTHMLVIDNGRVVEHRALTGTDVGQRRLLHIRLVAPDARLDAIVAEIDPNGIVELAGLEARFGIEGGPAEEAALLRRLIEAGLAVAAFGPVSGGLQDAYLALLREGMTA